ncbi:hypothetical protein IUQ79_14530 [Mycobacteroides abscessus subsp. bolletii]|uniref:hypothetical protein n=1 Tax=Mycobacteroides abscessus TaxID=36809 RepID=UPI0019D00288|nr:hypothetical protein [Mycobacteroides abscessus]MBN7303118.1 hypothetical protein [Mycobacteroides abscessus subsp. bolletii]
MLGSNKALQLFIDGEPRARIVAANAGPGIVNRLLAFVRDLMHVVFRIFGTSLAGVGAAHFVAPQPFEIIAKVAFPDDTRRWVYQNGLTELLLGLALVDRRTRVLGSVGGLAYMAFLINRVVVNFAKR